MSKLDWHNSIPHKQTKSEFFFAISWLELQTWPKKQDWRNSSNFKREKHCPRWRLPSPNKRLTYKKCFVRPVVDSKVNLRAEQSNDPRWSHRFQKCFHVSKMANHPSEISSLNYLDHFIDIKNLSYIADHVTYIKLSEQQSESSWSGEICQ